MVGCDTSNRSATPPQESSPAAAISWTMRKRMGSARALRARTISPSLTSLLCLVSSAPIDVLLCLDGCAVKAVRTAHPGASQPHPGLDRQRRAEQLSGALRNHAPFRRRKPMTIGVADAACRGWGDL